MKKIFGTLVLFALLASCHDSVNPAGPAVAKVVKAKMVDPNMLNGTTFTTYYLFAKDGTSISVGKADYALIAEGDTVSSNDWANQ